MLAHYDFERAIARTGCDLVHLTLTLIAVRKRKDVIGGEVHRRA